MKSYTDSDKFSIVIIRCHEKCRYAAENLHEYLDV